MPGDGLAVNEIYAKGVRALYRGKGSGMPVKKLRNNRDSILDYETSMTYHGCRGFMMYGYHLLSRDGKKGGKGI